MDIKQLGQGAHLLIPVDTPGGLFSAGDAHFAQGDCETCGTAIEMNATLHVRFSVRKGEAAQKNIRDLRFTRQDYYLPPEYAAPRRFYATTGISVTKDGVNHSEDITLAARNALLNMIEHLTERGWTRQQALRHLQRRRRPQDQPAGRRPQHARVRLPARGHLHRLAVPGQQLVEAVRAAGEQRHEDRQQRHGGDRDRDQQQPSGPHAPAPDARLPIRPSHQISGAMASTTAPATSSFLSTTAPTAAKAIAVLAQASLVRSRARPGS